MSASRWIGIAVIILALPIPSCQKQDPSHDQMVEKGKAVFTVISSQYPDVRPVVSGLATARPEVELFVPEGEWSKLSEWDKESLAQYVKSLIPTFRSLPDQYVDVPRTAPVYNSFRAKVASLCNECWAIGVGHLTPDGKGAMFDKVVKQGVS